MPNYVRLIKYRNLCRQVMLKLMVPFYTPKCEVGVLINVEYLIQWLLSNSSQVKEGQAKQYLENQRRKGFLRINM